MPFPLSTENEFKMMYDALPAKSLSALMATNRQLRSSVHSLATSLTLSRIWDLELLARHSWPQLVKLKLTGNRGPASTEVLCNILATGSFTSLQHLDLLDLPLRAEAMQQLAQGDWPVLTSLDLSGSFKHPDPFYGRQNWKSVETACKHLVAGKWPNLAVLKLADNSWACPFMRELFRNLCGMPALVSLDLSCNCAFSLMHSLAKVDLLYLQELNLNDCSSWDIVAPEDFSPLLNAVQLPHLMRLHLRNARTTVENIRLLSEQSWPFLAYLDLSHIHLHAGYMAYLVQINGRS